MYKAPRREKAQHAPETARVCYDWSLGGMGGGWEIRPGKQSGAKEEQTRPSCGGVWTQVFEPVIGASQTEKG